MQALLDTVEHEAHAPERALFLGLGCIALGRDQRQLQFLRQQGGQFTAEAAALCMNETLGVAEYVHHLVLFVDQYSRRYVFLQQGIVYLQQWCVDRAAADMGIAQHVVGSAQAHAGKLPVLADLAKELPMPFDDFEFFQ
jgi:hypothetical protein